MPYRIHIVLTDNRWSGDHRSDLRSRRGQEAAKGVQFAPRKQDIYDGEHIFDWVCGENGIEHRLAKVNHPLGDPMVAVPAGTDRGRRPRWTNGQVEGMNRTIKDATVRRYHCTGNEQLRAHLADFVNADNYARRLKALRGLTPFEFIAKRWTEEPKRFRVNPAHHTTGPNT